MLETGARRLLETETLDEGALRELAVKMVERPVSTAQSPSSSERHACAGRLGRAMSSPNGAHCTMSLTYVNARPRLVVLNRQVDADASSFPLDPAGGDNESEGNMTMFKRMLVAVDGSPTANRGFKLALALAKEHDAMLYVLHVVEDVVIAEGYNGVAYVPAELADSVLESLRNAGRKILARAEKTAQEHGQPVQLLLVETLGHTVAHAVLSQARKLRAELIVLGTHGRRGLARLVMGSDAEAILREARVPILVVRSPMARHASRSPKKPAETRRLTTRTRRTAAAQGAASRKPPAPRPRAA